jgi:hypothetical protein
MIFRPSIVARMWDTWLYYHEGTHYLFYLHNSRSDARWDGMSVATSSDGVHFADHGPIIHKAEDAVWLGTGMVWRAGEQFMLNFSEERDGVQEIFFAESSDLLHWRRLPDDEYVCRADPRWYADDPAFSSQRWDCIWVLPREDGSGYAGFLTAVARHGPRGLCGTAGCVVSDDGRHFRAAPPVVETGVWGDRVEVGAVEKIGDQFYMLLGVGSLSLGTRHIGRLLAGEGGMHVLVSDKQMGPYRTQPGQDLLLGGSPKLYTYFARFYRCGDELLLNHHTVPREWGEDVFFAPLKAVSRDGDGILHLVWWPGNEALKGRPLPVMLERCVPHGLGTDQWDVDDGQLAMSADAGGLAILPVSYDTARGLVLECDLTVGGSDSPLYGAGMFIEGPKVHSGTLLMAQSDGRITVGPYDGYGFRPEDAKPHTRAGGTPGRWRMLLRDRHVELYVDDELIQCYTLAHEPRGRVGFAVEASSATVGNVRAWEMSL